MVQEIYAPFLAEGVNRFPLGGAKNARARSGQGPACRAERTLDGEHPCVIERKKRKANVARMRSQPDQRQDQFRRASRHSRLWRWKSRGSPRRELGPRPCRIRGSATNPRSERVHPSSSRRLTQPTSAPKRRTDGSQTVIATRHSNPSRTLSSRVQEKHREDLRERSGCSHRAPDSRSASLG